MTPARLWRERNDRTPSVWSGALFYLALYFCVGAYVPFLYVHFADLGLSGKEVGLLATLAPIVALVVSPLVATVADRAHIRVRLGQVGLVCLGAGVVLLRFPTGFGTIVLLMLALALFSNPFFSVSDGLVARMAQRNGMNFGAMRLWGSFGFAVSALVCGWLWRGLGYRTMFIVAGVLFLLPAALLGLVEEGPMVPAGERKPASYLLRDRGLLLLLAAALFSGIANALSGIFSGIYARSLGGSNLLVGAMFSISALAELPTMFYSNRIADRFGQTKVTLGSYVVMGLAFAGYALVRDPALLLVLCAIKGLGYGVWLTATIRSVVRRTAEEWASTAQSLLTIVWAGLAALVAGPLGGLVHDSLNPAAVFLLAAGSLGVAAVVLVFARWRSKAG